MAARDCFSFKGLLFALRPRIYLFCNIVGLISSFIKSKVGIGCNLYTGSRIRSIFIKYIVLSMLCKIVVINAITNILNIVCNSISSLLHWDINWTFFKWQFNNIIKQIQNIWQYFLLVIGLKIFIRKLIQIALKKVHLVANFF